MLANVSSGAGFSFSEVLTITASLYRTLITGAFLAEFVAPDPAANTNLTSLWLSRAEDLRLAIFKQFWDAEKGAFFDGWRNKTLYPQDANSQALAFGVVKPGTPEAAAVSKALTRNWTPIGPASPELPKNVSPFVSSIELEAHFVAGRPDRAVQLIRDLWGVVPEAPERHGEHRHRRVPR